MKTYKITTHMTTHKGHFCPAIVLEDETGHKEIWKVGEFYNFTDHSLPVAKLQQYPILESVKATSLEHALDIFQYENEVFNLKERLKHSRSIVASFKTKVLKKHGKKLRGVKDQTKINNFLRN